MSNPAPYLPSVVSDVAIDISHYGRRPFRSGTLGERVTGIQLMDELTDTNICSSDRTERVVDFGRPALDGLVVLR